MDKTININLGGSLFQVDEEAFIILRDYIQAINNRFRNVPGGPETIEDIESRMAEIFNSQKGLAGTVTKQNVETMISTLGKPEDFDNGATTEEPPSGTTTVRRLYRHPEDMVISGVCGGLGAYFNADPVLFRILFILFTLLGGAGLLIYFVFWIAVPKADTEPKKRELYGKSYHTYRNLNGGNSDSYNNGFNEVIDAIGKVFYIILRVFLAFIGICIVLTGFLFLLAFVMIFVLKLPNAFTHHGFDYSITYFPDMLQYIFNPVSAPWIWALSVIVFILPMFALIYWGVKMIFWFRVNDGIFNLVMLIIWIVSLASLSVLLFNEGVSFAESSSSVTRSILKNKPDTLYIMSGKKIDDLNYDQEFSLPDDDYSVFITDSTKNLYIRPRLRFGVSDDGSVEIDVKKRASGRNRREANARAESIIYNNEIKNDTLILDEYFIVPSGRKWSADFVQINLRVPENVVLYFDKGTSGIVGNRIHIENSDDEWVYSSEETEHLAGRYWIVTESGLHETGRRRPGRK
ncbi:MAG TPA: PspC domain-containing protein [Bacteroidales bacterium]|nr:PspC domain-containing protein [Bacteroidales bacterium]